RKTGLAVPDPKKQERVDTDINNSYAKHSGLILKFPFNTKKKSYPFWDAQIRSSEHPMDFRDESTLEGLKVYRFEQTIPDTDLSAQIANLHYATHGVVWVEPATGVIIKGQQTFLVTLGGPAEPTKTTILNGTLTFTDDNIKASAKRAKDGRAKIAMISVFLPLFCLLLGPIVLAAGLLLTRGPSPTGTPAEPQGIPGPPSDEPTVPYRV